MDTDAERIEKIVAGFNPSKNGLSDDFVLTKLTGMKGIGLDSCVVPLRHNGLYLVQTTDFFYPLVDDPYLMGRVTCANVLSDLYAMGVINCDNMLMLLGVAVDLNEHERDIIVSMFIKGFKDAADSAGTKVRGGQTVRCPWLLLGGVASSVVSHNEIIKVDQAKHGDILVLTKPIGGQVAVNCYEWLKKNNAKVEELGLDACKIVRAFQQVTEQMTRLNLNAAKLLHKYHAHASTDVTGFGLLGHADNLCRAQKANVRFVIDTLPVVEYMDEVARKMPNGNGFNLFDGTSAETSGGLLVALDERSVQGFMRDLQSLDGYPAWIVGRVEEITVGCISSKDLIVSYYCVGFFRGPIDCVFEMHFVKKVPTTDEEKAVREKDRAIKLKTFCTTRDRIFAKRAKGELDDEILSLTQKLLEKNPDVYTFWNIRREAISEKMVEIPKLHDENSSRQVENLLEAELFLTALCLEENPKSYSAWFHRGWVLQQQKHPDIKRELALCDKALKLDCRCFSSNFHTWDHRRIVSRLGHLGFSEELEFSNRLIAQNFSNYSAWHYRAVLYAQAINEKGFQFDDVVIREELKKVTSAFFTDPDDQSAWMYTRFLIEMNSRKKFSKPNSFMHSIPLTVSFHNGNNTVVMSKACTIDVVLKFVKISQETSWKGISALCTDPQSARIWICKSTIPCTVQPDLETSEIVDISQQPYVNRDLFLEEFDANIINHNPNVVAQNIKDSCIQLMEMEPKNMWVHYTYILCLLEIDPINHHMEILSILKKLASELDVSRKELYKRMISRQILNNVLRTKANGRMLLEDLMDGKITQLSIREAQLSSLDGIELLAGLVTTLDVSGNQLSNLQDLLLPNLEYLIANENPLERLAPNSTLCNVKFLSMGACHLSDVSCILPALKSMHALERFLYCETPLILKTEELAKELPSVRLIPYYV
ncbi:selenide, water dikinase [Dictyocaulus viviparus]|uniref:Geranylgeranyl transferase type-2 subunit alpha n=1 Tax=Dictyocaulus viviparus TaxID=29172 RepID=A0A0D8XQD2_DICVI|nr:selenide, water dikinase [Dictyocaulus viviparus]